MGNRLIFKINGLAVFDMSPAAFLISHSLAYGMRVPEGSEIECTLCSDTNVASTIERVTYKTDDNEG